MKLFINFLAVLVVGWPALIVGYLYAAMVGGIKSGMLLYDEHENSAIDWHESSETEPQKGQQ